MQHTTLNAGSVEFRETGNYNILEKIAESRKAVVYKAVHKRHSDRLLALKMFKGVHLSENKKTRILQRVEHLKVLRSPLAITPDMFVVGEGYCFITQDYFESVSLDRLAEPGQAMGLADFFIIACSLARVLGAVHGAGIIHGGVKPHNILVAPATRDLRLIDFISLLEASDASHFIYDPVFIRQTLVYTSPEQTGRINHRVSFASDLYSLGVVFYELLSGRLPFSSNDPLEVIHAHLAREPRELRDLNPDVPGGLSKIVGKLLLKEPENRYQSSHGLLADLMHCQEEYTATGMVDEFTLDNDIRSRRVPFLSCMVGRKTQVAKILETYEQVALGEFRSLFISGLPGIGKTRLIQELQKPIVKHRGYFTSGKFDLYQKNIPYNSLIQALRNLLRTFLTESDERVMAWKRRIQAALGENGGVLTEVLPELEILIGRQPAMKPLPPVESLNRFHDLFDRFLTCLATKQNPLTLFIDDLQWCDTASFDFLEYVFANAGKHPHLFLMGAYRHNEVDASHPLSRLLAGVDRGGAVMSEIRLEALTDDDCHELVASTLVSSLFQTRALSDFIAALTGGNPLFIHEILMYLHHEDLLTLDEEGQWRWDLDKIRDCPMPTSVVALFGERIRKLPPELVSLLEYGACMGNTFAPATLAMVLDLNLVEIFTRLQPALRQGLLIESEDRLRFIHDRVQEAALAAIEPERRRRMHWRIGRRLLAEAGRQGPDLQKQGNLFVIVSHLNLGSGENPDADTAYQLCDINYYAGNKALDSLATAAANEYFKLSRKLLPDDCWQENHYDHTFRIFQKAAKTELMCGRPENSEILLNELLEHAKTDLDRAECLAEQTISLSSIGRFVAAIETANRGLAYFGKTIPDDPAEADRKRQRLMAEIGAKPDIWRTIRDMPLTEERGSRVEFAFYSELVPDYYLCGRLSQLYLTGAQAILSCLSAGMDEAVIYSLAAIGLHLAQEEQFELAFKYEDLVRDLAAKYANTFGAARGMNAIVWALMHSRSHPGEIAAYCLKSIQCGKDCGDLFTAGVAYGPLLWNLQVQGADLRKISDYADECLDFSERSHLQFSAGLARATQAGWLEPMMNTGELASMDETIEGWKRANHIASVGSFHVHRAISHYYFGEHVKAQQHIDAAQHYLMGLTDSVLKREWRVFRVLNAIKLHEQRNHFSQDAELSDSLRQQIGKIERWAELGPLLKPYLAFVYAELERVTGDFRQARTLYLDAIALAADQDYVLLEGLLNENLGKMLLAAGHGSARVYFTEAARLYRLCCAERKYAAIVDAFPELVKEGKRSPAPVEGNGSRLYTLPNLDISYLMKSSLAISAEIEQESLLKKIMGVVVESSGAQHGFLLVADEEGALFVRAECHAANQQEVLTQHRPLESVEAISGAIVRYVYRTGEKVILGDAAHHGLFKDNPEIQEMGLRSVLCLPVIKQSRVIGMLYLENRLFDGVFSPERTQMTELLTSQAAISMEHAALLDKHRQAEGQIRKSLREKEVMLKEINHRVKNNLQIIHSMLNLQMPHFKDPRAIELFKESQDRVYTMALIHEKLYQSESLAGIDLGEYVHSLIAYLFLSYGASEDVVRAKVSVANVELELDKVIPVALIINELVSNALKHAFPQSAASRNRSGVIRVELGPGTDREVRLTVSDNGVGLPEHFDLTRPRSLGLKLVRVLVNQVGGNLELRTGEWTEFVITFPI